MPFIVFFGPQQLSFEDRVTPSQNLHMGSADPVMFRH
jgi:hypothetical protein